MDEHGVRAEKRWEEEWAVVEGTPKSSGGQGTVTKVQHLSDGRLGALKRLHIRYVRHTERRLRMAREVEALARVPGAGIPSVFAHNMRYAKDTSVPLWFISEWIEGETLQHRVRDRPQRLEDALRITRELTELVARCHAAGVIHRDIKPDNVIVGRDSGEIILVDFGTAWAESDDSDLKTAFGNELGNRFFRIPDLSGGRERRDRRADVTLLVGLLFFLLTGRHPKVLVDERGLPPHEAMGHLFPEDTISDPRWVLVNRIMTVGFQAPVALRFQDADALLERIDEVLNPPEPGKPISRYKEEMAAYKEVIDSAVARSMQRVEEGILLASRKLEVELQAMASDADGLTSIHLSSGAYVKEAGRSAAFSYDLCRDFARDPFVRVEHTVELVGEERSLVRASYTMTAHIGNVTEYRDVATYYEGPAADLERLEEELRANSQEIFASALAILTEKLREAMGGTNQ